MLCYHENETKFRTLACPIRTVYDGTRTNHSALEMLDMTDVNKIGLDAKSGLARKEKSVSGSTCNLQKHCWAANQPVALFRDRTHAEARR